MFLYQGFFSSKWLVVSSRLELLTPWGSLRWHVDHFPTQPSYLSLGSCVNDFKLPGIGWRVITGLCRPPLSTTPLNLWDGWITENLHRHWFLTGFPFLNTDKSSIDMKWLKYIPWVQTSFGTVRVYHVFVMVHLWKMFFCFHCSALSVLYLNVYLWNFL